MSRETILNRLQTKYGLNDSQLTGIMANIGAESGGTYDSTVHQDFTGGGLWEDGGYGLAQWTDSSRKQGLQDYANSQGTDVSDEDTQVDYLISEMDPDLLSRMASETPEQAVNDFMKHFERPEDLSDEHAAQRFATYTGTASTNTNAIANTMADSTGTDPLKEGVLPHFEEYTQSLYSAQRDPTVVHPDSTEPSSWTKFTTGFMDAFTRTGIADIGQMLWGDVAHSSMPWGKHETFNDADIQYVKQALPNDADAQNFVLLTARDKEELQWLVNQKQVAAKRAADIQRFNNGNLLTLANAGRLVGSLADPLNFVPIGDAYMGAKIVARLGDAAIDLSRVAKYVRLGGLQSGLVLADSAIRQGAGGERITPKDYAVNGALAFVTGIALGGIGDSLGYALRDKPIMQDIAKTVENANDNSVKYAADLSSIRNETKSTMAALHDDAWSAKVTSPLFSKYNANGRAFAVSLADARREVQNASGMVLDDNTKAFYVPNEDYAIVIKDNVKPSEIDNLMAHEVGAHGDLSKIMGEDRYNDLLQRVRNESSTEGTTMFEARKAANSYDPEEILGYALENDMVKGKFMQVIRNRINRGFKAQGLDTNMTTAQVKDMLMNNADFSHKIADGVFRNPDGSTAFAGVKFSKENMLNPDMFAQMFSLEKNVTLDTQRRANGKMFSMPLQWAGKNVETGRVFGTPYGVMANSLSNNLRKVGGRLVEDVRNRGLTKDITMPAETNKMRMMQQLMKPYVDYLHARMEWVRENKTIAGLGEKSNMEFDKQAILRYNEKYAGNAGKPVGEVSPLVEQAVDHIKKLRDEQIRLGKRSGTDIGLNAQHNLIEKDWTPIDEEFTRRTSDDLRNTFLGNFKDFDDAQEFLTKYFTQAVEPKRDIILSKLQQDRRLDNARRLEAGEEGIDTRVTDADVDNFINGAIPNAVENILKREQEESFKVGSAPVGDLNFLRMRLPVDTSMVVKMPNGLDFSFDNNLRDFRLDNIVMSNINRFAGEAALKGVFLTNKALEDSVAKVAHELDMAVLNKKMDKADRNLELQTLQDTLDGLRGFKTSTDVTGRLGALGKSLQSLAYAKNGAMMGFAQLGELGGAIAYGGLKQLLNVLPDFGKTLNKAKLGLLTDREMKDFEYDLFGTTLEPEVWSTNWGDNAIRQVLTEKSLVNSGIVHLADFTHNLGKVTSSLNFLPKMTDSMVRGMRREFLGDSIRWAHGETFSRFRNPFSVSKLSGARIAQAEVKHLKEDIQHFSTMTDGHITGFDWRGWQQATPTLFSKWYALANQHAERAIVSSSSIGNRSILKDMNAATKILLQFKDYSGRAWNAQTLRALTTRDFDDGVAAASSMVTNTLAYAARAAVVVGAYKAIGADDKADEMTKYYFDPAALARAAAVRSAIIGTPTSFGNDVYEALSGASTIRTTVDFQRHKKQTDRTPQDVAGDFIAHLPAVREAGVYTIGAYNALNHLASDSASQKDAKDLLQTLPLPNMIPLAQFLSVAPDRVFNMPEKRPQRRSE